MTEMYWITTLGRVSVAFQVLTVLACVAATMLLIYYLGNREDDEEDTPTLKGCKKGLFASIVAAVVFALGCILVPSTKELYAIYGVGSVLDCVQNTDEAKKIPDNAVKAINKYLEGLQEDKKGK